MKKLYTLNTVNNFMEMIYEPFGVPFLKDNSDVDIINIMDDSLLKETREFGKVTPNVSAKMLAYAKAAEASGADGIITTCTSVNQATMNIKPFLNIPIINIEEPVAELAIQNGKNIGIIGTIPTSPLAMDSMIKTKAEEQNKDITIQHYVVEGAFDILVAGDRQKHDEMINNMIQKVQEEVDVIAFSQISMSLVPLMETNVPIYKIGTSGFEKIYNMMK
ncbi:aspartate/glutamate racemase family protein [Enterococcus sp. DIV0187]|uniref:aspartate/glutamate racemase family protein n=1 Tax=Enterococcus sp. DIV0187 TaxID=2774644 RepID=UPI003F268022